MKKIQIISEPTENKPFLVIYKPSGIPSAPITDDDKNNALFQAIQMFPEIQNIVGRKKIEYGLLHRIDTPTKGLLLIATSQDFYDSMLLNQQNNSFYKYYKAYCNNIIDNYNKLSGFPESDKKTHYLLENGHKILISSFFRNYGPGQKEVRPVIENSNKSALQKIGKPKLYSTEIVLESLQNDTYIFDCKIASGYRHQVRIHLAWNGFPIIGDNIYNSKYCSEENLKFEAYKLEFDYKDNHYLIEK